MYYVDLEGFYGVNDDIAAVVVVYNPEEDIVFAGGDIAYVEGYCPVWRDWFAGINGGPASGTSSWGDDIGGISGDEAIIYLGVLVGAEARDVTIHVDGVTIYYRWLEEIAIVAVVG